MEKRTYLISYIEDNDLGVYSKEILVESINFVTAFRENIQKYPTLFGIKEQFGEIEERWKNYYTHESQDQLQRSKRGMEVNIDKMFAEGNK